MSEPRCHHGELVSNCHACPWEGERSPEQIAQALEAARAKPRLPREVWHVEFMEGFGYPICDYQEHASRRYTTTRGAVEMVVEIKRHPEHHDLIGVWKAEPAWSDHTESIERLAEVQMENEARVGTGAK